MQIVKPDKSGINLAVKVLKQKGIIIYPTDTAYAMGGIFDSAKVVGKILKIKKRSDKKFTLIASDLKQVEKNFSLSMEQKKFAKRFWPGPLSIVVSPKFAVRVPKNKLAKELAKRAAKPLIATSANISGKSTIYKSRDVIKEFTKNKYRPDLILDCGSLPKIKTSTVVKVLKNKVLVLRRGSVRVD